MRQEVIQLLQYIDREVAERAQRGSNQQLYSTVKREVVSWWLSKCHSKEVDPVQMQEGSAAVGVRFDASEDRELRLEMVDAIPDVLHLNETNALLYLHLIIDLLRSEADPIIVQKLITKLQSLPHTALTGSRRSFTCLPRPTT